MISLTNISKLYKSGDGEIAALRHVSLNIKSGELVAIVGESGSGKSTLMNILGCLDVPSCGQYSLFGKEIQKLSYDDLSALRGNEIGFVFQGFNLLPNLSALENVALPLTYKRIPKAERLHRARLALERVGLISRINHRPSQMSGGQQQRVAIARALITNPQLILADEPTGNLDSKSSVDVLNLLLSANADGRTVVIITHDIKIADRAKRAICISDGEIIYDKIKEC